MFGSAIKETTTSTGTGNLTLAGAASGFRTINSEFSNDITDAGIYFNYHVFDAARAEWEAGIGHLSASGTLVRDYVERSSNADAAVNFAAGTKTIIASPIGSGLMSQLPPLAAAITASNSRLIRPDYTGGVSNGVFGAASSPTLWFSPYWHRHRSPIAALAFQVGVAGTASARAVMGIYTAKHDGNPGRLIVQAPEFTALTTTGIKHSVLSAQKYLPSGLYWLCFGANEGGSFAQWGHYQMQPWSLMGGPQDGVNNIIYDCEAGLRQTGWTYSATLPASVSVTGPYYLCPVMCVRLG